MKNESKHDVAVSKTTIKSLNADSATEAEDPEVFRLGQLMRESAHTNLPDSDTFLRNAVVAKLETRENELGKPVPVSESRQTWVMAVASIAVLGLAIISVLWITELQSSQHANFKTAKFEMNGYSGPSKDQAEEFRRSKIGELGSIVATKNKEYNVQVNASRQLRANSSKGSMSGETAPDNQLFVPTGQASVPLQASSGLSIYSVDPKPDSTPMGGSTVRQDSSGNPEPAVEYFDSGNSSEIKRTLLALYGDKFETIESPNQNNTSTGDTTRVQAQQAAAQQALLAALQKTSGERYDAGLLGRGKGFGGGGGGTGGGVGLGGENGDGYGISDFGEQSEGWAQESEQAAQMMKMMQQLTGGGKRGEQYDPIVENKFVEVVLEKAFSTFSIDVDTASYANMRRFISRGQTPPPNSIRIEELVNYFQYDSPQPKPGKPFHVSMEVAECPWQPAHRLVRIGLKAKDVHRDERPASNLVFLLDVSGSMRDQDKLPLLQRGLSMMLDRLNENDRISIVTYASNSGVRLQPTSGDQKVKIRNVIEGLTAEGSTNGSAGIEQAYALAAENFIKGGTNRVILATDGDLNVGTTDDQSLVELIKRKAANDVYLTVLGFGTGNLKDSKLEKLADNGNGVYAYIDSMREARKVLVQQMSASLVTVAKDVKLQVEFNPTEVKAYRLLGYENRRMANADFNNTKKDAGDIGAGHYVTAFYEIVPSGMDQTGTLSLKMKYQQQEPAKPAAPKALTPAAKSGEMLTLAINYKHPGSNEDEHEEHTLSDSKHKFYEASGDFRFAAAVASFGMMLRGSDYSGNMEFSRIERIASEAIGEDAAGYRAEFVDLVRQFSSKSGK